VDSLTFFTHRPRAVRQVAYPRRVFASEDLSLTLREAALAPAATLTVTRR
jgi:hypothetical protein